MVPVARLGTVGFWETSVFLVNASLFLLVGFQLRELAAATFAHHPWQTVLMYALVVNATLIVVRFAWVFAQEYQPFSRRAALERRPSWKHLIVVGSAGLRGAVSLAAALAIPLTVAGGAAFPERDLIVFLTFSVILITLIGGGLVLP
jgi:CPA1 family monovalent cation:H+ antiporter